MRAPADSCAERGSGAVIAAAGAARGRRAMVMGVLAFWIGLGMAAHSYPSEYDWRYMTISSLLYEDRNPHGYGWGRAGLVSCGFCGLYWVLRGVRGQGLTRASLAAGYLSMALCALLPSPLLGIPKPHEILALAAFIALCTGVSRLSFATLVKHQPGRRVAALAVSSLPLLPVVFAAAAQAYAARAHLPWVNLAWRARGTPAYWSFAFWEWLACAIFTVLLLWLVPGKHASAEYPNRA
jgi:hypothetical protein